MNVTAPTTAGYSLDPRRPLLTRPDGRLQIGWDPESALILTPPPRVTARALLEVLDLFDGKISRPQIMWVAAGHDIAPSAMGAVLDELERVGVAVRATATPPPDRTPAVRVHGRGPLSDALVAALRGANARITRSVRYPPDADAGRWKTTCVVLADDLVADPRLVLDLVRYRIPHLSVRLRDGHGIVGPLVLPGHTSCLGCADLYRGARDPQWPHLAAQLLGRAGHADPATVMATSAVALAQLDAVLGAHRSELPASVNHTLEIDLTGLTVRRRRWPRRRDCRCRHLDTGVVGSPNLPP